MFRFDYGGVSVECDDADELRQLVNGAATKTRSTANRAATKVRVMAGPIASKPARKKKKAKGFNPWAEAKREAKRQGRDDVGTVRKELAAAKKKAK